MFKFTTPLFKLTEDTHKIILRAFAANPSLETKRKLCVYYGIRYDKMKQVLANARRNIRKGLWTDMDPVVLKHVKDMEILEETRAENNQNNETFMESQVKGQVKDKNKTNKNRYQKGMANGRNNNRRGIAKERTREIIL
ncbi:hypothetical protein O9G_004957 [Rozella allomycis CSF55]|uniref:Uncharacterized protein n=1 Tax=Rozella allomycis (strain CSF55) TaxID=988480 RepID=A0A075APZ2_ROZAC|nr:hypothetical protein O9G_004957 [Rozella allomycis CSF55]|eukprot:EPZ32183.1 hypothetical protein O9G_004957 [Rozella allomycis CSF55]